MNTTFIYGLISTRDNNIRYIGKSNNPKERLRYHIFEAKSNKNNTHKCCWIRKELSDNFEITFIILDECSINEWELKEILYINQYQNLTNTSVGGHGGSPLEYSITYDELIKWKDINLPKDINSGLKWRNYIKNSNIKNIPINPNKVFKLKGWITWSDFLNTNNLSNSKQKTKFVSFEKFIKWLEENHIKNNIEFRNFKNRPDNIPSHPERFYKDNWKDWNTILPNSKIRKPNYLNFNECRNYLKEHFNIKTVADFRLLCKEGKLPNFIPKKPERVYDNFKYSNFLK